MNSRFHVVYWVFCECGNEGCRPVFWICSVANKSEKVRHVIVLYARNALDIAADKYS